MIKNLPLSAFIFVVVLLLGSQMTSACDCGGGANPCSFFRAANGVAFIGTVTSVVEANEKYGQPIKGKARKITIKVEEVFKGSLPAEVITSDDGYSCDNYPFSLNGTYLIYSKGILENTQNILPVGLCSGTAPVEKEQEAIKFLRQLKAGVSPSILYGRLWRGVSNEKNPFELLPQTKIVLTKIYGIENDEPKQPKKDERTITAQTDDSGEYKFENLAQGRYKLSAELPDGLWMPEGREFRTGGKPSCDSYNLYSFTDGRISGHVVSSEGVPVGFQKLYISSLDPKTRFYYGETQTDKDGNYTFHGLSEGQYKIRAGLSNYSLDGSRSYPFEGYPFGSFYYGNVLEDKEAQIITLGNTEKIQGIDLKMPPLPVKQTINAVVVWEDGTPAKDAVLYYRVKKLGEGSRRYVYQKADGIFSFEIYDDLEYEFLAENNNSQLRGSSGWMTFSRNELKNQIKLTMKTSK